jgi:ankyrin repeat protein
MDEELESAIYKACVNNHITTVSILLQYGANPNAGMFSLTPLYVSVMNNNLPLAKLLLDNGQIQSVQMVGPLYTRPQTVAF